MIVQILSLSFHPQPKDRFALVRSRANRLSQTRSFFSNAAKTIANLRKIQKKSTKRNETSINKGKMRNTKYKTNTSDISKKPTTYVRNRACLREKGKAASQAVGGKYI